MGLINDFLEFFCRIFICGVSHIFAWKFFEVYRILGIFMSSVAYFYEVYRIVLIIYIFVKFLVRGHTYKTARKASHDRQGMVS